MQVDIWYFCESFLGVCVWLLDTHMQQLYKVDHRNMFEITSFCKWDSQDFKGIPSVVRPRFDPIIGVR